MTLPLRIQRKRGRGWKMPPDAVVVTRHGFWGNPFIVNPNVRAGSHSGFWHICVPTAEDAVECYRIMLAESGPRADSLRRNLPALRGKNLACWCALCPEHQNGKPLGVHCDACAPCHADVLLELANPRICEEVK